MSHPSKLSDEELLLLHRKGDPTALVELSERLFSLRFYAFMLVAPELCGFLSDLEVNEAFFHAYLNSVRGFEFQGCRFITYFYRVYKNEVFRVSNTKRQDALNYCVSLDTDRVYASDDGSYSLQDVIPTGSFMDDPAAFFSYAESLQRIGKLPKHVKPIALDIVRDAAAGHRIDELIVKYDMSRAMLRYEVGKYRAWALKTIGLAYGLDDFGKKEKQKALDKYLGGIIES